VRALRRLRGPLALLVLASAALLLAQRHHVWDDRLGALSPIPQPMLDADATLRAQIGASDSGDLVAVRGASQEAVLQAAEALAPRLRALREQGLIGGFDSPARYLPSVRTQRARQAALPDAARLEAELRVAVKGLPVKAERFRPFVTDVQAARHAPLLTRADLAHSSFALALDGMLLRDRHGAWTALLPLRAPAGAAIDLHRVREALRGSPAIVVDLGATSNQLYRRYLRTAIGLSLAGVLGMAVLLLQALRSARRVARLLAPLLAAVVVVAAGLVLLGQRLNLLHLVGMMLVIAAGSNYALFFDRGQRHGGITPRTLASLVFANLGTVAGFGPLLLSGVPVLASLGATVAPGALLALVFSAALSEDDDGGPA
jgi:predicted exporter